MSAESHPTAYRYFQLAVIIMAAGAIYPLLYLRQNFEVSILESFGITLAELSQCYAMLGVLFVLTYVPSGWLADKVSPRLLVALSLAGTGLLGAWFSTIPALTALKIIFAGWGIATGLTFWSAHIKVVALLAHRDEQGRFFGFLDGGRGLFEAILATIAVAVFAHALQTQQETTQEALRQVIYLYVGVLFALCPLVYLVLDDHRPDATVYNSEQRETNFAQDLKQVLSKSEIWLCAICIVCGYQLFWATYSFSAYLQQTFGLTAIAVGSITVAKLWMRPIGAAAAGIAGDLLDRERVLGVLLVLASFSLLGMAFLPASAASMLMLGMVLFVGILTYAVRGIYWATLDSCEVPDRIKGLAIGVISLVGYSPDIYLPLLNAELLERFPGREGYVIYFVGLSIMGFVGAFAAWLLRRRVRANTAL